MPLDDPGRSDGIVVTPSHNPPRDGGFKYNPPHGGPADTDATGWIADRANELIAGGLEGVKRTPFKDLDGDALGEYDFREAYVRDLENIIDIAAIKKARRAHRRRPARRRLGRLLGADRASTTGSTSPSSTPTSTRPGAS